jgi:hypothetical protein
MNMVKAVEHQPVAPSDLSPNRPAHTTAVESVRIWVDLMKSADKLILAGFIREVGPELAHDAYRRWQAERSDCHSAHLVTLARKLNALGE